MNSNEKKIRIVAVILCLIGLGIAGSVAWTVVINGGTPQCIGGSTGCATVEKSDYSKLFGIHVSIYGIVGYALILGASLWKGDKARVIAFMLAFFGFCFSLYLTYLELWVIHAICQWCVASAATMTILMIVCSARMLLYFGKDSESLTVEDSDETL